MPLKLFHGVGKDKDGKKPPPVEIPTSPIAPPAPKPAAKPKASKAK